MFRMLPEQPAGEAPRFATSGARWRERVPSTLLATWSIQSFSHDTVIWRTPSKLSRWWSTSEFDPFLADKDTWESTVEAFRTRHPELDITYIYTGPSELNTKKKTHLLLYVFTEEGGDE